ncbi:GH25 family lysozyme [Lactobacillus sp. ESL0684]|uniref:GH25 family lysozyme n=1 Tax=Lactobacillus sp. ESL0684 TaxID=2983213 RepID=UPI0023F962C2|nr:GH25 family lysozyme [Lactobacillus sp. ESL0684]WEV43176.1 GH25 family lysozyme [Lactobacillus sp. ESL0684]
MKRFHHKFTLPAILILLVITIGLLLISLTNYKKQTTLPANSTASAIGVELNQDFGYLDLHQLQSNGISFVYLRSTQGRSYFDDDYLVYRDQILATKLAFGTVVAYSNESTPLQHYRYFMKKVGANTGSLPILIEPAVSERNPRYLQQMGQFCQMLMQQGKSVMVDLEVKYQKYFPDNIKFMADSPKAPSRLQYAFWLYTNNGHVKNVAGLEEGGVTMITYNGTVTQYKQKYGQLTQ